MFDLARIRARAAAVADPPPTANAANPLTDGGRISGLAGLAGAAAPRATPLQRALADAIDRCCDARGDDDRNRQALHRECMGLSAHGQADMLAHFTLEAARWAAKEQR